MRIRNLNLTNIGPFKKAELEFISDNTDELPIICITGENGTGKSIIIDAIRALFNGRFQNGIERDITSNDKFEVKSDVVLNNKTFSFTATKKFGKKSNALDTNNMNINRLFVSTLDSNLKKDFIFDYWTSKLSNDSFNISNITLVDLLNLLLSYL